MADVLMEGRQDVPTAERDIIEQLGRLHQEAQYRLQPSVQSAPENQAHRKSLQHTDQLACSLAHEAAQASSNAPADTMSHLPAIRISDPTPALKQEAADSRSTLSEADAFEPGSIPTTAHSSPMTPPSQVQPAFPLTPPPAPVKQSRSQRVPSGCRQTAAELLANPSTKRSLQPAFDAAAAQAGMPLYELQPFEPLRLEDADPGLPTVAFPGSVRHSRQRRRMGEGVAEGDPQRDFDAVSPLRYD